MIFLVSKPFHCANQTGYVAFLRSVKKRFLVTFLYAGYLLCLTYRILLLCTFLTNRFL